MVLLAAILVAFAFDARVIALVNHYGPLSNDYLTWWLRRPGQFQIYVILVILLGLFHKDRWKSAGLLALSCIWAGITSGTLKWVFGRMRPRISDGTFDFHPFINGIQGLFAQPANLSFPSGDATLAFAGAICLAFLLPKWRWAFFAAAMATGLERIAENDHHLSEVVAAGLAGYWSFRCAMASGKFLMNPRQNAAMLLYRWSVKLMFESGILGPPNRHISQPKHITLGLLAIGLEGLAGVIAPKGRLAQADDPTADETNSSATASRSSVTTASHSSIAGNLAVAIHPKSDDHVADRHTMSPARTEAAGAPGAAEKTTPMEGAGNDLSLPAKSEPMTDTKPYLSLVIPAYNEEESIPTLLQRVEASLNQLGRPYELLIIDDGSTDKTPQLLAEARQRLPWLRVLRMVKNAGQSAGFEAGFAAAKGDLIATIDADLQNDPEEIPRLVKMLEENKVDMITGWRKDRKDTNFRKWQSRQANRIRNWITQETVNDSASSLKVYRASAIQGIKLFRGAHRYFPTLVKMRGGTVLETPVKHSPRFAGTAKYGFGNRAFVGIADLFGVRWMKSRYIKYEIREVPPQG